MQEIVARFLRFEQNWTSRERKDHRDIDNGPGFG
jgi:hypothetical protein